MQEDLGRIKSWINSSARFCYYRDLNGVPEGTSEGKKILISDGERVRAQSVILDIQEGEFRFDPPTVVNLPHPESPSARGFKYVDAEGCGKYSIEFMGMEYGFRTFHDLVRGILKHIPESRNSLEELKFQVWVRAQGLDLSSRQEFSERIDSGTVRRVLFEHQIENVVYPATDADVLKKRFSRSSKGNRLYSFEQYLDQVCSFYEEEGEGEVAEDLKDSFDFSGSVSSDVSEIVKEKVRGVSY